MGNPHGAGLASPRQVPPRICSIPVLSKSSVCLFNST